jgi:hypothetical protein
MPYVNPKSFIYSTDISVTLWNNSSKRSSPQGEHTHRRLFFVADCSTYVAELLPYSLDDTALRKTYLDSETPTHIVRIVLRTIGPCCISNYVDGTDIFLSVDYNQQTAYCLVQFKMLLLRHLITTSILSKLQELNDKYGDKK